MPIAGKAYAPGVRFRPGGAAAFYYARKANRAAEKSAPVPDLSAHAFAAITFPSNPASNATITLGGTVVTFGTNVTIGANLAATLANLLAFLNASVDANIIKCVYSVPGNSTLGIVSKAAGTSTFTVAAAGPATISHSPLVLPTITKRQVL